MLTTEQTQIGAENAEKAFWFDTWVGNSAKGWVAIQEPYDTTPGFVGGQAGDWQNPTSVTLTVYELDSLDREGWLAQDAQGEIQYYSFRDFIATIPEGMYFKFPLWKDTDLALADLNADFAKRFYLAIDISYKNIFPRFGHDRDDTIDNQGRPNGHRHDYQWSDQLDILHHGQLLQRLLLYASQQGQTWMSQQPTDLLSINQQPNK